MKRNTKIIEVGDLIRAYDFKPCPGRPDLYVVGIVDWIGLRDGYTAFQIRTVYDSWDKESGVYAGNGGSRAGMRVDVPMQTSLSDWDGRVTKI